MSEYKSWEQREAEAQLTRAQAAQTAAEAEAKRIEAERAARIAEEEDETRRLAEEAKRARLRRQITAQQQEAADDDRERKARRREERLEKGVLFKRAVALAVFLGAAVAIPAQVVYFTGLEAKGGSGAPSWYLAPLPFFIELLAWVGVLGTQWARRKGLVLWPFWLLTGALAGFAGVVNGMKGLEWFGPVAGISLAGASIIGPVLWEIREALEARAAGDGRTAEQRAADKRKAREQAARAKAEARRNAAQDAQRRELFPKEWEQYMRLLAAHPDGTLTREEAWADARRAVAFPEVWTRYEQLLAAASAGSMSRAEAWAVAWHAVYRLPVGQTPESLAATVAAEQRIEAILADAERTPERHAVDAFLAELFPPSPGDDDGLGGTPRGPRAGGPHDGGQGPRGTSSKTPSTSPSEGATALGRKGKQGSGSSAGRTAPKVPDKPLAEADLEAVRKLARDLGGAHRLSVKKIRTRAGVGGADAYLVRLRDAVQREHGVTRTR